MPQGQVYVSPILLLEDCGTPVVPEELNIDDRQECSSLLYRSHQAGWNHESFAARNILVQAGPLSDWPICRIASGVRSFRLIDFGRSVECTGQSRAVEEIAAERLFGTRPFS